MMYGILWGVGVFGAGGKSATRVAKPWMASTRLSVLAAQIPCLRGACVFTLSAESLQSMPYVFLSGALIKPLQAATPEGGADLVEVLLDAALE